MYFCSVQVVAPKKAKLGEAEHSLNETLQVLEAKRSELREVENRVETLKSQFAEMTEKKKQLENQVSEDICKKNKRFFFDSF